MNDRKQGTRLSDLGDRLVRLRGRTRQKAIGILTLGDSRDAAMSFAVPRNLLNAAVGFATPIRTRIRLMEELKRRGVDVKAIPDPCLQQLADGAVEARRNLAKMSRSHWREEVIDALEGEATILAYIIEGAAEERLKLQTGSFDGRRAILARYGVKFAPRQG